MSADSMSALLKSELALLQDTSSRNEMESRWWLRARYEGQGHELDVPVTPGESGAIAAERFVALHVRRTGFTLDRPVECISVRTAVVGSQWPVKFKRKAGQGALRDTHVDEGHEMERTIGGPAVIRLPDATLRVAEGWVARALPTGGWLMERS